jgi:peptide/nickel transport system permease protein
MIQYYLWTDLLFLGVLVLGFIMLIRGLRKEPMRRAFQTILMKPIAVSASIILLFFLAIAVLDSVHTTSSSSLLDRLLYPLGAGYEKTYSAPLALTLYSSETLLVHGKITQEYPRLTYIPKRIKTDSEKWQLIQKMIAGSSLVSFVLLLVLIVVTWLYQRVRYGAPKLIIGKNQTYALLTLFICFLMIIGSYWVSRDFHLLGTGKIGQDIFYYTVKSIRTGLIIGLVTTLFMMPLALLLGIASGYFGGVVDDVIQYIYTTLSSIPGVLLITASVLSMQTYIVNHPLQFKTLAETADARLLALCFILGITSWTSLCRVLRAEVLKLREIDFILAAKALGSSASKIISKHLLPNLMHVVLITLVLDFSYLVLAEAVLTYVGVGVSPMTISWGNMINAARLELAREPIIWWPVLSAFLFMFMLVLASNLLSDAVRDAFDPRQER